MPQEDESEHSPSTDLTHALAEEVAPEVGRFVGTIAGSPSFEVGELIAGHFRFRRFKQGIKQMQKAQKLIEEAGLEPHEIPMRTLVPLVEGGSTEDDESMSDRWAALLANAAGGDTDVPPSFASVLRDLQPEQARFLDFVYESMMQVGPDIRRAFGVNHRGMRGAGFDVTADEFVFHVDNLLRLRLVRGVSTQVDETQTIALTEFGRAFVRACRPPAQPDPPIVFRTREEVEAAMERRRKQIAEEERAASDTPGGEGAASD